MKLAFSTLGCPDWGFDDIFSVASDLGYHGIEIRGIADELYAPKIKVFQPDNIEKTKDRLTSSNLQIPILTPGAYLTDNVNLADSEFEIKDYVLLANKLNVKYIRVMGEKTPEPVSASPNFEGAVKHFQILCDFAARYGITLLIETNGFLADSKVMKNFICNVDRENAGVLWDIHHTVRFFDETPLETVKNIGSYIKHTHIKDSVRGRNGMITYMLTGYGDIPIDEAVYDLKNIGYDGYFSYEWVKRWYKELAEPGVSFYQYINYMRDLA